MRMACPTREPSPQSPSLFVDGRSKAIQHRDVSDESILCYINDLLTGVPRHAGVVAVHATNVRAGTSPVI
jgi:hypothetical protein